MISKNQLVTQYISNKKEINKKLTQFKQLQNKGDKEWTEELIFCIFAANSSASMGLKAVELVKPYLQAREKEKIQQALRGKVRFYNIRAKYLLYNLNIIDNLPNGFYNEITKLKGFHEKRLHIKHLFKGIGNKEASHLLRNLGYSGYAIIDKHILNTLQQLELTKTTISPKTYDEYIQIEELIKNLATELNINMDALDLVMWSNITGEIIK